MFDDTDVKKVPNFIQIFDQCKINPAIFLMIS